MPEGRRKFTKEFKVEAVRLVKEGGRTLSQVARDLGVNVGVLGKWCRQLDEHSTDAFPGKGRLMPQEEELRRLKRENEDLKEDRAILKKALAIFSRGPK
jgi:transposase